MGLPNPNVLTEFLIEYLWVRNKTWTSISGTVSSYWDDNKTKKTKICTDLNSNFYKVGDSQIYDDLKRFDGWPNILTKLGDLARSELAKEPDSFLADTIYAMIAYILDALSESPCFVYLSDTVPTDKNIRDFPYPAYVLSNDDKIFYINQNKINQEIIIKEMPCTAEAKAEFKKLNPDKTPRKVTNKELETFEFKINHTHDELSNHINRLVSEKDDFSEQIKTKKQDLSNMIRENKSPAEVNNAKGELSNLISVYNTHLYKLIDCGHLDTIIEAELDGVFCKMPYPNEALHGKSAREVGCTLNYSIPLFFQKNYDKLFYKLWIQDNKAMDYDASKKSAKKTTVDLPQDRKDPVVVKQVKSSFSGAATLVGSWTTSSAPNSAAPVIINKPLFGTGSG